MNIQEAIEFLQEIFDMYKKDTQNHFVEMHKCNEIIYLFQQDEKYKVMWEELQKNINGFDVKTLLHFNGEDFKILINHIEEKYFSNY